MSTTFRSTALLSGLGAMLAAASVQAQAFLPPLPGTTFDMNESYAASINLSISGGIVTGNIAIKGETSYEVGPVESYTQACPDPAYASAVTTVDCYKISYTGTASANGKADVNVAGFNFSNVGLRISDARWDGFLWLRASDLATVSKKREIEGSAEVDLFNTGLFQPAATVLANEFEDYITPLVEYKWPLTQGETRPQKPHVCVHGNYDAAVNLLIINDTFADVFTTGLDINFSVVTGGTGSRTLDGGQTVTFTRIEERSADFGGGASQNFDWSPELRYAVRQEINGLSIAGLLDVDRAVLQVTDFNVPPTPTPTPGGSTPTPTPTGGPSKNGASVSASFNGGRILVTMSITNTGAAPVDVLGYALIDIYGEFYWLPAFSLTDVVPAYTGAVGAGATVSTTLIDIPGVNDIPGDIVLPVYGAAFSYPNVVLIGDLAVANLTL